MLPVFYMSVAPCLTTIKQITYDKDFTFFIFDGCDKIRQESGENMLISVEHLSKRQNIKEIVNDVSFAIEDRDKIALIGVNGTGKTTLLRMLAGLETYEEGSITKKADCVYPICHRTLSLMKTIPFFIRYCLWIRKYRNSKQNQSWESWGFQTAL